mmetsp:Transcript_13914/g.30232  ORF Transcript_13914/g.30232 Transcript_13914/m.30232 type:complete len:202 (-) Transcript_13914:73-678(-)
MCTRQTSSWTKLDGQSGITDILVSHTKSHRHAKPTLHDTTKTFKALASLLAIAATAATAVITISFETIMLPPHRPCCPKLCWVVIECVVGTSSSSRSIVGTSSGGRIFLPVCRRRGSSKLRLSVPLVTFCVYRLYLRSNCFRFIAVFLLCIVGMSTVTHPCYMYERKDKPIAPNMHILLRHHFSDDSTPSFVRHPPPQLSR